MMKKALLSLLLVAVFMPFAMAQTNPPAIVNVNAAACETYLWDINGVTYTNSTVDTYIDTTTNTVYVLNLTVNHTYSNTESITSQQCSYTWRGNTYYHSGSYSDTVLGDATLGTCDSFFFANITIPTSEVVTHTANACGSYSWNDSTYTESGIYSVMSTIENPDLTTCLHIERLVLSIVDTLYINENVEHCGNYAWYGNTYSETGSYTHMESDSVVGCDTLHTLNLTIVVDTPH